MTDTTTSDASTPTDAPAATAAPRRTGGGLGGKVLAELQEIASELGITGAEKMRKGALIDAIKIARGDAGTSTKAAVKAASGPAVDTTPPAAVTLPVAEPTTDTAAAADAPAKAEKPARSRRAKADKPAVEKADQALSLIHISEPTRLSQKKNCETLTGFDASPASRFRLASARSRYTLPRSGSTVIHSWHSLSV
ncbi:Rho termination factor N-terminal domain-containing protein, partial [Aeromicrobium fastidiosum]|uniref:Rho termination factor N-terminal domain-containing protein n=1 Tax=Aeromicrobium fastidiosum TaxID=52699 RepID=UPI0020232A8D